MPRVAPPGTGNNRQGSRLRGSFTDLRGLLLKRTSKNVSRGKRNAKFRSRPRGRKWALWDPWSAPRAVRKIGFQLWDRDPFPCFRAALALAARGSRVPRALTCYKHCGGGGP